MKSATRKKEIASPEYENQIQSYQRLRVEVKDTLEEKQREKEELLQKAARGKQVLSNNQFTDQDSITAYSLKTQTTFDEYSEAKASAIRSRGRCSPCCPW